MTARVSEADFPGRIVSDRSWPRLSLTRSAQIDPQETLIAPRSCRSRGLHASRLGVKQGGYRSEMKAACIASSYDSSLNPGFFVFNATNSSSNVRLA
jgi:hypothetical protein